MTGVSGAPPSLPVLASFGRFTDGLVPLLRAAAPTEEFVEMPPVGAPPPPACEILATLAYDSTDLERALLPSVRWVHVLGAGVDGFPLDLVGDRMVTCSRGASAPAIAEWVLAVMLAFEKQLPQSWVSAPPPQWNIAGLGSLAGRTLGLIGLGAIGEAVARRALSFEMRVVALRRTGTPPPVESIHRAAGLEDLLGQSDHVVVAAPATPETFHLLDASALASLKPGTHLVNVARGSLVDQEALRGALDDGRLAMASLDVTDPEPLPAGHWLYTHPRVRLSPHISWSSPGSINRTIDLFVENLRRFRTGAPLRGTVDPAAGY